LNKSTRASPTCSAFDFSFLKIAISSSAAMAFPEIGERDGPTLAIFMAVAIG
jgi:hypothetical protein